MVPPVGEPSSGHLFMLPRPARLRRRSCWRTRNQSHLHGHGTGRGQARSRDHGAARPSIQEYRLFSGQVTGREPGGQSRSSTSDGSSRTAFHGSHGGTGGSPGRRRDDETKQELRSRGEIVFVTVTPILWEQIGALRTEIDRFRSHRPGTPPREMAFLEDDLDRLTGRLDSIYSYGWTHLQKMESFGLDTQRPGKPLPFCWRTGRDEVSGRLGLASLTDKGNQFPG